MGHNSARYIHVIAEALKLAFADRERYYGDSPAVPLTELLSPEYLRERAKMIRPDTSMQEAPPPGDLSSVMGSARRPDSGRPGSRPRGPPRRGLGFWRTRGGGPTPCRPGPGAAGRPPPPPGRHAAGNLPPPRPA